MAFSPDGRTLASGSVDNYIHLRDLWNPELDPQVLRAHSGSVSSVAYLPDGSALASAGDDSTIRIWQLTSSSQEPRVLTGHQNWVGIRFLIQGWF